MQQIMNSFSDTSKTLGVKISITKIEVIYQLNSSLTQEVGITIDKNKENSSDFAYLARTVLKD